MNTTFLEYLVFIVASLMMLVGALGVVMFKNPVHAALGLVLTLFGVAVQFVAQEAHFLAAVQVIVYAGAIVVLFLFVIMLLGVDRAVDLSIEPIKIQRPLAAVMSLGLIGLITAAVVKAGDAIGTVNPGSGIDVAGRPAADGQTVVSGDGNIQQLAQNLYNDHVLAFELTSVLLIVAVVGTVLLTRKWPKSDRSTSAEATTA
jgi:NADH-quinone oxidoreductase subunit J